MHFLLTKIYNVRAQLLFCSSTLLFGDVLVAVAVLFCVKSLLSIREARNDMYLHVSNASVGKGVIIVNHMRTIQLLLRPLRA